MKRSSETEYHSTKETSKKARDTQNKNKSAVSDEKEIWGKVGEGGKAEELKEDETIVKEKAFFGLTGALAKDENTGNIVNGVVLKWSEPLDCAKPDQLWRLYVFKDNSLIETLHISKQSSYLIGRDSRVADIIVANPSCSKQHAVIQFRKVKRKKSDDESFEMVVPYLLDLKSAQKTFVNGKVIEDSRYFELREKDCIKFGASMREYVLLHDKSTNV